MNTALNDAAFRLISHSLVSQDSNLRAPRTDEARRSALRAQYPDASREEIDEAIKLADRLEQTAIEMADVSRGPGDGHHGPPLTQDALAELFPEFSGMTYFWAAHDGLTLTRK